MEQNTRHDALKNKSTIVLAGADTLFFPFFYIAPGAVGLYDPYMITGEIKNRIDSVAQVPSMYKIFSSNFENFRAKSLAYAC